MPPKTDAQANRSRRWITEALLSLMNEQDFAGITVTELARRADLDRRTFYRHFDSKEAVIAHHIRELAGQYDAILRRGMMDTHAIALAFFSLCCEHRDTLVLLHRHRLLPLLLYELNDLFPAFHYKYHTGPDLYAPHPTGYALAYHVGGFWNVLLRWIEDGMAKTPEELADTMRHILPEYI